MFSSLSVVSWLVGGFDSFHRRAKILRSNVSSTTRLVIKLFSNAYSTVKLANRVPSMAT